MARVFSICVGLLLWLAGSAWGDKPKIAVLGLEAAATAGGAADSGAQLIAREVTKALRQRVQSPGCPFLMAPNSNKELFDEKLLMSCDNEAPDCMVVIGAGLASDVLLYGRVDKRGESFRISLKLLDVKRRTVQPAADDLPVGGAVAGVSRRLYAKLIGGGVDVDGALLVTARSDTGRAIRGGTVKIDDDAKGRLAGGKLTVTDIFEGRHTVAIDVPGFQRLEEIVTIRGGEQATLAVLLHADPGAPPPADTAAPGRPSPVWKWSLVGGAAVALGAAGYAFYSYDREVNHNKVSYKAPDDPMAKYRPPDSGDCGKRVDQINQATNTTLTNPMVFARACTWHTRTLYGIGVAVAGSAVAIASLIMMSRDPGPAETPGAGARGKKPDVAIAPILTSDVAGAQLSLAW